MQSLSSMKMGCALLSVTTANNRLLFAGHLFTGSRESVFSLHPIHMFPWPLNFPPGLCLHAQVLPAAGLR